MKKLILLILVCSLLLLTVTSCLQNNKNEQTTPQDITESTTPIETTTSDASNYNPPIFENEIDRSSNLITVLLSFLNLYLVDINPIDFSLADKIDMIKSGVLPESHERLLLPVKIVNAIERSYLEKREIEII